jgi:hypothetical protein
MLQWIYSLITFYLRYTYDKDIMIATIYSNKPYRFLDPSEREEIAALQTHLDVSGYCVIVRR